MFQCVCPGENHPTYGACLRGKNLRVGYCRSAAGVDRSEQNLWDREISLMDDCKRQGVVPRSTKLADMRRALDVSDRTGRAFDAGDSSTLVAA